MSNYRENSLVPRRSRRGQSLYSTVSCDVTERDSPAFSQTSGGQRVKRERLRTRLQGKEVLEKIILVLEKYFTEKKTIKLPPPPSSPLTPYTGPALPTIIKLKNDINKQMNK